MPMGDPLPLLPLPNVLLYPEAILPFHASEPDECAVAAYLSQQEDPLVVVALQLPGADGRVHPLAGLGRVLQATSSKDGWINLLVTGLRRVCILDEPTSDHPFRMVQVSPVEEAPVPSASVGRQLHRELREGLIEFAEGSLVLMPHADASYLADLLTVALPLDVQEKQRIFAMLSVEERCRSVLRHLRSNLERRRALNGARTRATHPSWN